VSYLCHGKSALVLAHMVSINVHGGLDRRRVMNLRAIQTYELTNIRKPIIVDARYVDRIRRENEMPKATSPKVKCADCPSDNFSVSRGEKSNLEIKLI
jgi:hypothetical protein